MGGYCRLQMMYEVVTEVTRDRFEVTRSSIIRHDQVMEEKRLIKKAEACSAAKVVLS